MDRSEAVVVREEGEDEEDGDGDAVVLGLIPLVFMTLSRCDPSLQHATPVLIPSSDSESESGSESGSGEDLDLSDDVESDGEDQETQEKPYMALLQSFSESSAPNAKRRKLNHGETEPRAEESGSDESEAEEGKDLDYVEAEGEEAADEIPEAPLDDDEEDASDPFDSHFANADETSTSKKVKAVQGNQWTTKRSVTKRSRVVSMHPAGSDESQVSAPGSISVPDSLKLKQRLRPGAASVLPKFDEVQRDIAPMLSNYQDIFYCQRTVQNSASLRNLTCLHALNHVFK